MNHGSPESRIFGKNHSKHAWNRCARACVSFTLLPLKFSPEASYMRRMALLLLLLLTFASIALSQDSDKSSFISDNVDKSVDPCVDFFQYACGNWLAKHPIPADRATYGTGSLVFDQNLDALHDALEVASNPTTKRNVHERRVGDYYAACMDERSIDAAG